MDHRIVRDPKGNLQHLIDGDLRAIVPPASAEEYLEYQRKTHGREFHVEDVQKFQELPR